MLLRIETPHYAAGIIYQGDQPVKAAPILYWVVKQGWPPWRVKDWAESKGYAWQSIP